MAIPLEAVAAQWKSLGWDDRLTQIENQIIMRLAHEQQLFLAGRKQLVDATKDFKKLSNDEQAQQLPSLLKIYQKQIDEYSQRLNSIESEASLILKPLLVLSNPTSLLEDYLIVKTDGLKSEELRLENDLLRNEMDSISEKLMSLEKNFIHSEKLVNEKSDIIQQYSTQIAALQTQLKDKGAEGRSIHEQLVLTIRELDEMKSIESSLRSTMNEQLKIQEQKITALKSENDILAVALDQSRSHCLDHQQEISKLKLSLDTAMNKESEINDYDGEIAELKNTIVDMKNFHDQEKEKLLRETQKLKEDLSKYNDYDDMKQMLKLLKKQEFGTDELNGSLEEELMAKCRKIESEMVKIRIENEEVKKSNLTLEADLVSLKASKLSLEKTLEQYEQIARSPSVSPHQSSVFDDSSSINVVQGHSDEIIAILTNQRERLKKRNHDLEIQVERLLQESQLGRSEMIKLKGDYGKVQQQMKFLENEIAFRKQRQPQDIESGKQNEFVKTIKDFGRIDEALSKVTRVLFTNRMGRKLTTIYLFALHVAFFILLMRPNNPIQAVPIDSAAN